MEKSAHRGRRSSCLRKIFRPKIFEYFGVGLPFLFLPGESRRKRNGVERTASPPEPAERNKLNKFHVTHHTDTQSATATSKLEPTYLRGKQHFDETPSNPVPPQISPHEEGGRGRQAHHTGLPTLLPRPSTMGPFQAHKIGINAPLSGRLTNSSSPFAELAPELGRVELLHAQAATAAALVLPSAISQRRELDVCLLGLVYEVRVGYL